MMARLYDDSREEGYCGAVLISNRAALTVAHCLRARDMSQVRLSVGDYDVTSSKTTCI